MNVLVTGAQGFIGRFLVAGLLAESGVSSVTGIGRSPLSSTHFTHDLNWCDGQRRAPLPEHLLDPHKDSRYHYVTLDLNDTSGVRELLEIRSIDHVVHLAGALRDSEFTSLMNSNVTAAQSLLNAVFQSTSVKRFVLGSSGSVYGRGASLPAVESDQCKPLDFYAVTKLAAEHLLDVHNRDDGMSVAIARIFNVVGPGLDERHLCAHLARQFAEIGAGVGSGSVKVGPLESTRDFIDVRDVSHALILLLRQRGKSAEGVFNLASGDEQRTQYVYELLANSVGASSAAIDRGSARKLDIDRAYADTSRLRAIGFNNRYTLPASLATLLAYYQSSLAIHQSFA